MYYKHGLSKHPLHRIWSNMKQRGTKTFGKDNPHSAYNNIGIYKSWLNFEVFYEWAKDKWSQGLEIDRIDTLRGYTPSNCRFVSRIINQRNRTDSRFWFIDGTKYESKSDAAEKLGVSKRTIHQMCRGRYQRGKWNPPKQNCYSIRKYHNG